MSPFISSVNLHSIHTRVSSATRNTRFASPNGFPTGIPNGIGDLASVMGLVQAIPRVEAIAHFVVHRVILHLFGEFVFDPTSSSHWQRRNRSPATYRATLNVPPTVIPTGIFNLKREKSRSSSTPRCPWCHLPPPLSSCTRTSSVSVATSETRPGYAVPP